MKLKSQFKSGLGEDVLAQCIRRTDRSAIYWTEGLREAQRQYHASAGLFRQEVGEVPDTLTELMRQWQRVN